MDIFRRTEAAVKQSRESFFGRISRLFDRGVSDEVWDEVEETLIAADVGVSTTARLLERTRKRVREERLSSGEQVRRALRQEMAAMLSVGACSPTPSPAGLTTVLVIGVNGSGKTTSIAKLACFLRGEGRQVILAAADTFRAAAIDQLKVLGDRTGVEVIAHSPGGDPGAVVFDALQAAKARGTDVVIIDTAGRLHTKLNLMEELKKIDRVISRALPAHSQRLLVLDANTGQNGLAQAKHFTQAVGIDGIFLAKLDSTARGGIVFAICDELQIPVLYIGTGEQVTDMAAFDPQAFAAAICPD
ncbi:MAG: signal recognition particle-docking protein FtsY [Chloroflexota bacterium]